MLQMSERDEKPYIPKNYKSLMTSADQNPSLSKKYRKMVQSGEAALEILAHKPSHCSDHMDQAIVSLIKEHGWTFEPWPCGKHEEIKELVVYLNNPKDKSKDTRYPSWYYAPSHFASTTQAPFIVVDCSPCEELKKLGVKTKWTDNPWFELGKLKETNRNDSQTYGLMLIIAILSIIYAIFRMSDSKK